MKIFQIFSIVWLSLFSINFFGMVRRVAPKMSSAGAFLNTQTRQLLPGQENNPLWIKANKEIQDFRAALNLPTLTQSEIQAINQSQAMAFQEHVNLFPAAFFNDLEK